VAALCLAGTIVSLLPVRPAWGGERKFLVMLANPRKEYGATGVPPEGLPNPELIRKQYFDTTDPSIGSFAEYWEEISYGDVKIGRLDRIPEWINLPWPIHSPVGADNFVELDGSPSFTYGAGESFDNTQSMVAVSTNSFTASFQGGNDTGPVTGLPVYMPGERFVDMDGDSVWDGLDEAMNWMDWNGDNAPDLLGPWTDLNENGAGDNPGNCLYLADDDNDGNPDCCPDGPGNPGCEPYPADGSCFPTRWEGPFGEIVDCNGNLIPDACDVDCNSRDCRATGWLGDHPGVCGGSRDELPFVDNGVECAAGEPNGIPDECEIDNARQDCVGSDLSDEDLCNGGPECVFYTPTLADIAADRCEFHDVNNNRRVDIVEPFENFLVRWNGSAWVEVTPAYIQDNYPGNAALVIGQRAARPIYGEHDPLDRIPGFDCTCPDGSSCVNVPPLFNVCPAGTHAEYNPPDAWFDLGSTKMRPGAVQGDVTNTPEPPWYRQAWVDRYGTEPPAWGLDGGLAGGTLPIDLTQRRCFRANRGGTRGDGTGWVGCSDADPDVVFGTADVCFVGGPAFSQQCDARVLPEQLNGLGAPIILYDGIVEYDDLPSSKYHRAGDQRLGEVTSPYNDEIWGDDRGDHDPNSAGGDPDFEIPAAGPYATSVHANYGRDAGNVLQMELLTWRTEPPFNTGDAWEQDLEFDGQTRRHWLAGSGGEALGFRDYNLDGLVDQGEVRRAGTENYTSDQDGTTANNGVYSRYPFNRQRLLEDCIAILDDVIDFDDYVDIVTLDRMACSGATYSALVPEPYWTSNPLDNIVFASGLLSSIILLPPNSHIPSEFRSAGSFDPVHNEDGLGDPLYLDANFPREPREPVWEPDFEPQISWNLFVNNLVHGIEVAHAGGVIPVSDFATAFAAHEYLHTWEQFPDLYDYDVFQPGAIENCPIGRWDIMADGGLVHPVPILKEKPCTGWAQAVDLATVATPGVDAVLTLKPAEFVRDDSYYYLENEDRPGERYYFWSAGLGFDERMPGEGMLILHTDVTPTCETDDDCQSVPCQNGFCDGEVSNPDAPPQQQRSGTRPTYTIVQADGEEELAACVDRGDAGDPWPGSTGATRFNYDTTPAATWYTQNSWIGLDILDVIPDEGGSILVKLNWVPTSIPSLRFVDPPGGESVASIYQVRFDATDVYGGTTIRLYYIPDVKVCSGNGDPCSENADCPDDEFCRYETVIAPGETNFVGQRKKSTPGTNAMSISWNIGSIPDGRYVVFAKLIPGQGADGTERRWSEPRPGRNNIGTGSLTVNLVNIDGNAARSETWNLVCVDAEAQRWSVHSSLSQPVLNEDNPAEDPYPRAATGQPYTSPGGEVRFTITASDECLTQNEGCFVLGDTFTFTTTGITAASRPVTIIDGQIKEDPTAVIVASPLFGDPPLRVTFDGRSSFDPNGEPLNYRWDFGDGSPAVTSAQTSHVFQESGTFTTVLRVTNPRNGRFGEAAVDIEVTNDAPRAVISATPKSGPAPLEVQFSAAQSDDTETPATGLIYQWDFGDGATANNALVPGTSFQSITHLYRERANGTLCTISSPCTFVATLTVIDEGGKEDTDSVSILAGNTNPRAVVTYTALEGPTPWEVVFNASGSFDPDGDPLTVEWIWGDGTPNEILPLTGAVGSTDGSVPHTYVLPSGQTSASFSTMAKVRDDRGGLASWGPVVVVVTEEAVGSSDPRAIFTIDPAEPVLGETFTVDASLSFDRPTGGTITSYQWSWGDQTASSTGVTATHVYNQPGTYTITLTVADDEDPPNTASTSKTVEITDDGGEQPGSENEPPTALFTVNPASGFAGATVFTFDATRSTDPDGDDSKLTFRWEFGDGGTAAGPVVTHVFQQPNVDGWVVRLSVRDEDNAERIATREVVVMDNAGNLPPRAYIATGPRTGTAPATLTFNGQNSYDPNGDPLDFRWEFKLDGQLEDVLVGSVVTKVFKDPGSYTVELEVSDGRGGVDRTDPQNVLVIARTEGPDDGGDGEPPEPEPPYEIPDSADQRPAGGTLCGFGMIMGLFGSLMGLLALRAMRQRRPW
jgi:PKD repeat protein